MANITIRKAQQDDMHKILSHIVKFRLDCENLVHDQFYIAEINGNIAGFGRIKPYQSMFELATIGVLEKYRKKNVGSVLVKHLIEVFPSNEIWISTKVSDYFGKLGFQLSDSPPEEIKLKHERVCLSFGERPDSETFYMVFKKS